MKLNYLLTGSINKMDFLSIDSYMDENLQASQIDRVLLVIGGGLQELTL